MAGEHLGKSEVPHGSVVFCKGRKLHSSSEPARAAERTAAPGRAAGCRGCPVPCRVDTAGLGRGSKGWVSFTGAAKSIMQQLLGSDRRDGWVDINGEPNWQHINGWRPCYSGRKPSEGRRCTHHLLQLDQQPGPPHHSEGYPSNTSNRNKNLGLNSEPQMPLSLMGYLHITKSQGFLRCCLEEGGETLETLWGTPCPPTRAPQTLPGRCSTLGTTPLGHCGACPFSHPAHSSAPSARGSAPRGPALCSCKRGHAGTPGHLPKLLEPSPPAWTPRTATPVPLQEGDC